MLRWRCCLTLCPTVPYASTVLCSDDGASKWPRHSSGIFSRDYVTPNNCRAVGSELHTARARALHRECIEITSHSVLATQRTASLRMHRCTGDNKLSHNATAAREPRGSREEKGPEGRRGRSPRRAGVRHYINGSGGTKEKKKDQRPNLNGRGE
jgi:hypothetical protein